MKNKFITVYEIILGIREYKSKRVIDPFIAHLDSIYKITLIVYL